MDSRIIEEDYLLWELLIRWPRSVLGKKMEPSHLPKILLVEDNELNRDMLSRRLSRSGFEVLVAVDGRQALEMTRTFHPELVLMDMSLPEIDGWEATSRLKADPSTRQIPIIALTAHAMVSDREKAYASGCDDYETKPVEFRHLLEKIHWWLDLKVMA